MNIVHCIYSVGPGSFGLGPVALNLAKEQECLGERSNIWCVDNEDDCKWAAESSGLSMESLRSFSTVGPKRLYFSPEMERAADGEAESISLVHQHALWTGLSRVAANLHDRHGIPTVISPHGSLEKWALKKSYWKKRIALSLYERRNLHNASCLHACSEQEIEGFREFGLKNPVAIIPNGISKHWLESAGNKDAFLKKFGLPAEKRIMLFLSRISPVKGLPMLIEALGIARELLDDWLLVIAGADEFNHKAELLELIRRLNLEKHIRFIGMISGQDKRNAFSAADFFVLPTRREAAPVVVLEALGAGIPVLTTKGAPWKHLLTHNCGWWTEVGPEAIADGMTKAFIRTPDELRQMGQKGKELVASKYSWELSARKTIELYKWLLGQTERPDFVVVD